MKRKVHVHSFFKVIKKTEISYFHCGIGQLWAAENLHLSLQEVETRQQN